MPKGINIMPFPVAPSTDTATTNPPTNEGNMLSATEPEIIARIAATTGIVTIR